MKKNKVNKLTMISNITSAIKREFIYFFNFLDNCLRNKNNNLLNYTLTLSSLIIFFSIFLIIYGLKLRVYSPIFEDDFHMLSLNYNDIEQILNSARPVGYVFVALSSFMPDSLIYISVFILTIINISLPIFILSVFLNIKKNQFFLYLLFASFITCSFYEYFVSLKHIRVSGLFSSLFFYLNVLIFFIIFKIKNNFLIIFYFILSFIFLLCSFFSKEDFILSNILMFIIFILYAFKKKKKIIFYSSFSILIFVIFFWIYINLAIYENPFILDGKGIDDNYQKNLSLFSIIFSYGVYLFYFTPTAFYSFYFFLLLIVLKKDINNIKSSIVFITFILLIIFPFSLLHKKFITEYIMQWFPILSSLIAFYLSFIILNKKFNRKLVLGLLSILFLIILNASIISKSELISLNEKLFKSYNYISGIKENLQIIKKNKLVKIDLQGDGGVPNPWYRQTGTWFERKLNLNNKWYVFTDTKSKIYAVKNDFHYDEIKHNSKILILARSEINNYEGITLKFDPHGNLIEIVE